MRAARLAGGPCVAEPTPGDVGGFVTRTSLRLLVDSTFLFAANGRRNFDTLAEVARTSDCYQLTMGQLDPDCRLVLDLFDRLPPKQGDTRGC